jgi:hypothetical protein
MKHKPATFILNPKLRNRWLPILILLALFWATGCTVGVPESQRLERPDFGQFFQDAGVEGAFVLYDQNQDTYLVYNPERVDTPYIPASTFKIFNSLVALETGEYR